MVVGHGGYVHGSHIVDACIDDDDIEGMSDMEHETVMMRSSALNGKSPDIIPKGTFRHRLNDITMIICTYRV